MCAIFGSFSKEKIVELGELNRSRGVMGHSITCIDTFDGESVLYVMRSVNEFKFDPKDHPGRHTPNTPIEPDRFYWLCHVQAPTSGELDRQRIHPARIKDEYLWHNGVVRSTGEQKKYVWDTMGFLKALYNNRQAGGDTDDALGRIKGSFACAYHTGILLKLFRNALCPMYIDDDMNISSVEFNGKGVRELPSGSVFNMELAHRRVYPMGDFDEGLPVYHGLET